MTLVRIVLEIDKGQSPLEGTLTAHPDLERTFTGWIGLLSALQEAIVPADTAQARSPQELPEAKDRGFDHDDNAASLAYGRASATGPRERKEGGER